MQLINQGLSRLIDFKFQASFDWIRLIVSKSNYIIMLTKNITLSTTAFLVRPVGGLGTNEENPQRFRLPILCFLSRAFKKDPEKIVLI